MVPWAYTRVHNLNGISIGSAVLAGLKIVRGRPKRTPYKIGNISETVQDRDAVITDH